MNWRRVLAGYKVHYSIAVEGCRIRFSDTGRIPSGLEREFPEGQHVLAEKAPARVEMQTEEAVKSHTLPRTKQNDS
jgi:hypothetical protein